MLTDQKNPVLTVLLVAVLATAGVIYQYKLVGPQQRPAVAGETALPELIKIVQPNVVFNTTTFKDLDKTFVSVPFKFEAEKFPVWLNLSVKTGEEEITFLLYHPMITGLDWDYVEEDEVRLYQRNKKFKSVADFLKNPPDDGLAADDSIVVKSKYEKLYGQNLNQLETLDGIDYILTTNKTTLLDTGLYAFETIFDARGALLNNDQLSWYLEASGASEENPLYLDTIHVDYR